MTLTESARAILSELARDATDDADDDASEHEAGCTCPACVVVIERFIEVEAERPLSLETMPDGRPF